jgi:alkylhydroperoxidase family enzyme
MCEIIGKPLVYAPPALCDLVALVVSQDNSCRYCYGVQRTILRIYGYSDTYLDRLVHDFEVADVSASERAAIEFARRLSRANPRPGRADFERLVASGLERMAAVEVAVVTASDNFSNRVSTLLALPPEDLENVVHGRLFRFMRPLMAWRLRPRRRTPEPLPHPNEGVGARVVAALEGSPSAGTLRRAVDGAFASTVLPRRTKLLMLAVVARALGCRYGEEDCRPLLAAEGLAQDEIDTILATLGSPKLGTREARLVRFARDTVRYQPGPIQARMREICAGFSREETVEAAAFLSLANALCRLSVVLDAR